MWQRGSTVVNGNASGVFPRRSAALTQDLRYAARPIPSIFFSDLVAMFCRWWRVSQPFEFFYDNPTRNTGRNTGRNMGRNK